MSSSSSWLTLLHRVREYRREVALQSLGQSVQAAQQIRHEAIHVETTLSWLVQAQEQCTLEHRLNPERLRQVHKERENVLSRKRDLHQRLMAADTIVRDEQIFYARKCGEADVLQVLHDRLDANQKQALRRQTEQTQIEAAASLCNGEHWH